MAPMDSALMYRIISAYYKILVDYIHPGNTTESFAPLKWIARLEPNNGVNRASETIILRHVEVISYRGISTLPAECNDCHCPRLSFFAVEIGNQ